MPPQTSNSASNEHNSLPALQSASEFPSQSPSLSESSIILPAENPVVSEHVNLGEISNLHLSSVDQAVNQNGQQTEVIGESRKTQQVGDSLHYVSVPGRNVCRNFLNCSCYFGMRGRKCKFRHPKICQKLIDHGLGEYECNGKDCSAFHPNVCTSSLLNKHCDKCGKFHVRGTIRRSLKALILPLGIVIQLDNSLLF